MKVIKFPVCSAIPHLFLGGSTAKGDWQKLVMEHLSSLAINIVDTSRDDWFNPDPPSEDDVIEHIDWELDMHTWAYNHFINITADTTSPTVLLELGMAICGGNVIVCVDPDYSHYNHVRAACLAHSVPIYTSFNLAIEELYEDLSLSENF